MPAFWASPTGEIHTSYGDHYDSIKEIAGIDYLTAFSRGWVRGVISEFSPTEGQVQLMGRPASIDVAKFSVQEGYPQVGPNWLVYVEFTGPHADLTRFEAAKFRWDVFLGIDVLESLEHGGFSPELRQYHYRRSIRVRPHQRRASDKP